MVIDEQKQNDLQRELARRIRHEKPSKLKLENIEQIRGYHHPQGIVFIIFYVCVCGVLQGFWQFGFYGFLSVFMFSFLGIASFSLLFVYFTYFVDLQ